MKLYLELIQCDCIEDNETLDKSVDSTDKFNISNYNCMIMNTDVSLTVEKPQKNRGVATNSILLSFVQCLTLLTSILQTMILSRALTETEYGTYSQGLLVVNFIVPFLLLGLANAITYFSGQKNINVQKYISTIASIVLYLGIVGAIGILLTREYIQNYFGNDALKNILPLVAFLPLLLNMISVYQTLFVAENMATSIAIRNAVVAIVQIVIIAFSVFAFHDIRIIFVLLIAMDFLQVVIFAIVFKRRKYVVKLQLIDTEIVSNILRYSIPLALSTAIGTISIYMDKLLIGNMMSVEDFALYTNMAKELPFAFIISSFTTVIMPIFIRIHADGDDTKLRSYWAKYLELGICIVWILCGTAIFCARDLLLFLYSEKYERGISIFIVYLVVELLRFSYFGIILSTFGKTKIIMFSSLLSLICNFVLNIVLFHFLGMIGPAIASLISIFLMQTLQILQSCHLLKCKVYNVLNVKFTIILIIEIITIGTMISILGQQLFDNSAVRLVICGGLMVTILALVNYGRFFNLIKDINRL